MMQIVCPRCAKPYAGEGDPLAPDALCTFCDSRMLLPNYSPAFRVLDSGKRRQFPSGAVRDDSTGKGRFDLLPMTALEVVAKHFEAGAVKYGDNNWRKGVPMNAFFDSGLRHLVKAIRGDVDEDHLAAAAWNILCAIETRDVLSKKQEEPDIFDAVAAHREATKNVQFPPTAPEKISPFRHWGFRLSEDGYKYVTQLPFDAHPENWQLNERQAIEFESQNLEYRFERVQIAAGNEPSRYWLRIPIK